MSDFWHWWVICLIVFNWSLVTLLLIVATRVKIPTRKDGTTGHVWAHGTVREGVRKLPLWWIVISIGSLIFAIVYLYQYPGFGNTKGSLGWTSAQQVHDAVADNAKRQSNLYKDVLEQPIAKLATRPDVLQGAGMLYAENCAGCHGVSGRGNTFLGAPDLADEIWLYGSGDNIKLSIENGRKGIMPSFGHLKTTQLHDIAMYVYTLNGRKVPDIQAVERGEQLFQINCAVCHGQQGQGNQTLGAANLTDDDWLYSGSVSGIFNTLRSGRQGVMPAWKERFSESELRLILIWIEALPNLNKAENANEG